MSAFDSFFHRATGHGAYPYQRRLAVEGPLPSVVSVPTGLGKTAAMTMAWLWRRRFADEEERARTPRRLVYCLPMRVLVEQTRDAVVGWLDALDLLGGQLEGPSGERGGYDPWAGPDEATKIRVFTMLGGDVERDWDRYPERDAVLIGTQDLLLSRALNRGYAMSRFRWPLQFGLLNSDALWVFDEVQLMGSGLATSAQLQAFRRQLGARRVRSVWMSATLQPEWLRTVDFLPEEDAPGALGLGVEDRSHDRVRGLVHAPKRLARAEVGATKDGNQEAESVLAAHEPGTRTLVVVNTVRRAMSIHAALEKKLGREAAAPELVLIHSRFRPPERAKAVERLLEPPGEGGTIAVSTQVVEAGVDVTSHLLWTDLAPWPSLVQRFGRCNRRGEDPAAEVRWFDQELQEKKERTGPYATEELIEARERLKGLESAAASDLPPVGALALGAHVVRRRDLLDLFDTSPDLAGADVDVSRFIREQDDHNVFVAWRRFDDHEGPLVGDPRPRREELCPVPIGDVRERIKKGRKGSGKNASFWRWSFQDRAWERARSVVPGAILLAPSSQGDYDPECGWLSKPGRREVPPVTSDLYLDDWDDREEAQDDDPHSQTHKWATIAEHTDDVVEALEGLLAELDDVVPAAWREPLRLAARWHDRGKAHPVFQGAMPEDRRGQELWGKSGDGMARYARRGFRHELASALAMLAAGVDDLAAYLAAAHHGKVRVALRAQVGEEEPKDPHTRFAMGVWDGDVLPEAGLGDAVVAPEIRLSLGYAELGEDPETGPSWVGRVLGLVDNPELGPFRLALLEALMRVADWRGSAARMGQRPEARGLIAEGLESAMDAWRQEESDDG